MSKSVEVSELPDLSFARRVEINFSKRLFAGHFNKAFVLKLRYVKKKIGLKMPIKTIKIEHVVTFLDDEFG